MKIFKSVSGQGENVVVIHGGGASHCDMVPVIDVLSPHYCVINIDLPGTGGSNWNDSIQNIHDLADYILDELPKEAVYIGWSFGGLIIQSIAARYPGRVKHFIGIGSSPKFIATYDWPGFPAPGFSAIVLPMLEEGKTSKDFLKMFYEYEFANINPRPALYNEVKKLWSEPPSISNKLLAKRMEICDATDLRDLFKNINCPIDLIMGDKDANVPVEAFEKIKALNTKVRVHIMKGAGHVPFWTHPTEFSQILNKLLN